MSVIIVYLIIILPYVQDCECEQVSLHLHAEIENLKQRLLEREHHIVNMETDLLCEADKFPNGEYAALTDQLLIWQDKYSRLFFIMSSY